MTQDEAAAIRIGEVEPSGETTGASFGGRQVFLPVCIAGIFIVGRLWRLTASCLWFDEIFSVHAARHTWSGLFHFVAADIIHPPLFYALLKIWIALGGESLLWLRLFPALTSLLTIIPFLLLGRELRLTRNELNLALLLMAVNGYLIKYAQEVRMYSLLLFLALCSFWLFVRFLNSKTATKKDLLALFAINLLLIYSHYAGWLVVVLETVPLIICRRSRLRPFLGTFAALVLAYLPWIYEIGRAAEPGKGLSQNIGWVVRPRLRDLGEYVVLLNRPFFFSQSNVDTIKSLLPAVTVLVLLGIPLLMFGWPVFRSKTPGKTWRISIARWLFLFAFGPALLAFLLSWVMPYSIWGTRHLIIAAGPYSILAAVSLLSLRRGWLRTTVLLLLTGWFVLSGVLFALRRPPRFIWCAWDELAKQLIAQPDTLKVTTVYTHEDLIAYHLWFALNADTSHRFKVVLVPNFPGAPNDPAYFLPRNFTEVSTQDSLAPLEDKLWLAFRVPNVNDAISPLNVWLEKGYEGKRAFTFQASGQQAFLVELERSPVSTR